LNTIKELIKDLLFNKMSTKVGVDTNIYLKLVEEGEKENTEAEMLLNKILYERYEIIEDIKIKRKNKEKKDKDLIIYYKLLNRYLYASLNRNIKIGKTNDSIGRCEKKYILKDYFLSKVTSSLSLKLERNEEYIPISFKNIEDITMSDTGDTIKIFIYMPNENWRFYLEYDLEKFKNTNGDFDSNKLELMPKVLPYEKYKNTDNLKYYLEKTKYNLGSYVGEKLISTKEGRKLYFINCLSGNKNLNFSLDGCICFISARGNEGILYYDIKSNLVNGQKEHYIEIIDVQIKEIDQGIGRKALEYLDEIAVENHVKYIIGDLATTDLEDHKNRLIHFYKESKYEIKGKKIIKKLA
jgi:hypothetical protein